jgi:hypothetical protein
VDNPAVESESIYPSGDQTSDKLLEDPKQENLENEVGPEYSKAKSDSEDPKGN